MNIKFNKSRVQQYIKRIGKNNYTMTLGPAQTYSKVMTFHIQLLEEKVRAQREAKERFEAMTPEEKNEVFVTLASAI